MPTQPHPNDLRDLYIKLNPNGWCDEDLEKDSLGFVDPHTSQYFNSFRAGHQAGQEDSERLEAERDALQRLLNKRDEEMDRLRTHLQRIIGQAECMLEAAENSSDPDEDDEGLFDECREYIRDAEEALEAKS